MRCYEFKNLNNELRVKEVKPKTYLDYLRGSDYSERMKSFYGKAYKNGGNVFFGFKEINRMKI